MTTNFTDPTVAAWFEGCHELTKVHLKHRRKNVTPGELLNFLHLDIECLDTDLVRFKPDQDTWVQIAGFRNAICTDALRLRRIIDRGMKARARNLARVIVFKLESADMPRTCFGDPLRALAWTSRMLNWRDRIAAKYLGGQS